MKKNFILNISQDFILNILASLISTGVMQLVIYPELAAQLGAEEYGIMLTVMGYVNVITLAFGNNLCNARLLQQKEYEKKGLIGDYQILVFLISIISGVAIAICCIQMNFALNIVVGIIFTTIFTVFKSYYLVAYRIEVNYLKNLIANFFISLGYILGIFFVSKILSWPWVFTLGCVLGLGYIWYSSDIMKEPFVKTELFKSTVKIVAVLMVSGLIGNVTIYLDRFIIYPLLGGESVSVYSTAAYFAKSLTLVLSPITSVLLSYLTGKKFIVDKKRYVYINIGFLVSGVLFAGVSITLGKYITALLYPTLIEMALPYLPYASVGAIIGIVGTFTGTVVLAYAPIRWQTIIPAVKLIIYFVLCFVLVKKCGLYGLCIGVIITNTITYLLNFVVGFRHVLMRAKD